MKYLLTVKRYMKVKCSQVGFGEVMALLRTLRVSRLTGNIYHCYRNISVFVHTGQNMSSQLI